MIIFFFFSPKIKKWKLNKIDLCDKRKVKYKKLIFKKKFYFFFQRQN
jgi:hypothetical protein